MLEFTPDTLVTAIRRLFELNNYQVDGPTEIHGAEVDLIATPLGDPFGRKIYIEATVEYVDNNKYGKDVGKLAMMAVLDPQSQKLIISSSGFSLPVKERAGATNILTLTYDELFQKFEKFDPYVSRHSGKGPIAEALEALVKVYEEPQFDDALGIESATAFLTEWKNSKSDGRRWIVVTGEYGTGKTALTQVLLYRWLVEYKNNPGLPIPFRIELRSFSRQFDARGLLHHFLDSNGLSHISIDFAEQLVRTGRAVMLLDGYDEMAQYFNARERRQCLEALATLSADGAKGILTSRPNYFTRSSEVLPDQRRRFLQKLAVFFSRRGHDVINEQDFRDIVQTFFKRDINRHSGDARIEAASRYFSDLRSSATLTRSTTSSGEGWRFSHNSLREFLVAEDLVEGLIQENVEPERVSISDAMRAFSASIDSSTQERLATSLSILFQNPTAAGWVKGQYLELLWNGFLAKLVSGIPDTVRGHFFAL